MPLEMATLPSRAHRHPPPPRVARPHPQMAAVEAACREQLEKAATGPGEDGELTSSLFHYIVHYPDGTSKPVTALPINALVIDALHFLLFAVTAKSPFLCKVCAPRRRGGGGLGASAVRIIVHCRVESRLARTAYMIVTNP